MAKTANRIFTLLVGGLTVLAMLSLAFVIWFVAKEALPLFQEVSPASFFLGSRWMPVDFGNGMSFGIFNFIMGTLAVSLTGMLLALVVGLGAALYLSCAATERVRTLLYPVIDLLAGIPSVVYGFVGLMVLKPIFIRAGVKTGLCVLAAGIVLAVMLLPYLISASSETMLKARTRCLPSAMALGISKWDAAAGIVLPASARNILMSAGLAVGRAMGETMAVMMVMGNANLFPKLLGKGESIAALIALEMGTAVADSTHYHALYAAGFALMILLFVINLGISALRSRLLRRGGI